MYLNTAIAFKERLHDKADHLAADPLRYPVQ
jgi:hypothetical protein